MRNYDLVLARDEKALSFVTVPSPFRTVQELEIGASAMLLDYVRESGAPLTGEREPEHELGLSERYDIRIISDSEVDDDLQHFLLDCPMPIPRSQVSGRGGSFVAGLISKKAKKDRPNEWIIEQVFNEDENTTRAFNLATRRGVERRKSLLREDELNPPYYSEFDQADFSARFGSRLLQEIFEPGKRPELAELAIAKKRKLITCEDLPVRVMTAEEKKQSIATARLSGLHLLAAAKLLEIYQEVAYPDDNG